MILSAKPTISSVDHYFHLKIVLFFPEIRTDQPWDGRTKWVNRVFTTGRDCEKAEWINLDLNGGNYYL